MQSFVRRSNIDPCLFLSLFLFSFSFFFFFLFSFFFFLRSILRRSTYHLNRVVNCEKVRPYITYFFLPSVPITFLFFLIRFFSSPLIIFSSHFSCAVKSKILHCSIDSNTRFLNSSLKLRSTMTWRNVVVKYTLCIHRKQYAAERCSVFEEM